MLFLPCSYREVYCKATAGLQMKTKDISFTILVTWQ